MSHRNRKRLPKILKINRVDGHNLTVSVLFSTGEDRVIDFGRIFREEWKISKEDVEYILLNPLEFGKVAIANDTLSWSNVALSVTGLDGTRKKVPYDVGADTLYDLSMPDEQQTLPVGLLFKKARLAEKLSQSEVAQRSGTSRTYITRLENGKLDVEIMTLKRIVEAGLNKHLAISIE
jgi:DNA-binding XRE family transcriptional regulator